MTSSTDRINETDTPNNVLQKESLLKDVWRAALSVVFVGSMFLSQGFNAQYTPSESFGTMALICIFGLALYFEEFIEVFR
jgi:hypothetical protein